MANRMDIVSGLINALIGKPGQTARELAFELGLSKKDINPFLYGSPLFTNDGATKPRWFMAPSDTPLVASRPLRVVSTPSEDLRTKIIEYLRDIPGPRAQDLKRSLAHQINGRAITTTDINSILYGNPDLFARTEGPPPRWFLKEHMRDDGEAELATVLTFPAKEKEQQSGHAAGVNLDDLPDLVDEEDEESETDLSAFFISPSGPRPSAPHTMVTPHNPFGLYQWQEEALDQWKLREHRGIVDAVTGAGKTRLAVAAIADHLASGGITVVLVPTVVLLRQWAQILEEMLPPRTHIALLGDGEKYRGQNCDVVIAVMASARSRTFDLFGREGLLVVDECHRVASDKNRLALQESFAKRLGLSATHERMDQAHETVLLPYFRRVVFTLDYERGIRDGVIASVRTAFVGVSFDDEERESYIHILQGMSSARRKLIREFGCRAFPFSAFLDDVVRLCGPGSSRAAGIVAQRWMGLWRKKKDLLASTPAKAAAVRSLVGAMADAERTLVFTQSIAAANALRDDLCTMGLRADVHHSEMATPVRDRVLAAFAHGDVNVLVSVQTLEEGVDVPDADLAIIVAASKQRRQMVQRMGRVMRRKADGRDARFIMLYVNETDEDPKMGAHELFVGELLKVARESSIFSLPLQEDDLREFVRPDRW